MRRLQPLLDLKPEWLATEGPGYLPGGKRLRVAGSRFGMGLSFLCPLCGHGRVRLWFANPADGELPAFNEQLYHRLGDSFEELTLDEREDIRFGHWRGRLIHGVVETER